MKHVTVFNTFLQDIVNLNQSRINVLEQRVNTITDFLKNSDLLKENYLDARPQGSWAIKTIIKPLPNKEFDADLRARSKISLALRRQTTDDRPLLSSVVRCLSSANVQTCLRLDP